jgi:hypothetical protein
MFKVVLEMRMLLNSIVLINVKLHLMLKEKYNIGDHIFRVVDRIFNFQLKGE